jgi:hypothetical protein
MILEYTSGKMVVRMKGFTWKIRSMVMGCTHGWIRRSMKDGGLMENNMD